MFAFMVKTIALIVCICLSTAAGAEIGYSGSCIFASLREPAVLLLGLAFTLRATGPWIAVACIFLAVILYLIQPSLLSRITGVRSGLLLCVLSFLVAGIWFALGAPKGVPCAI